MGRPSEYTQEIADRICEELAKGHSLRSICEADDMPTDKTVRHWLAKHPDFLPQYASARESQADFYADEIIEIADTAEDANLARLRVDARKWKAARMAPRKWGDKLETTNKHEHSGEVTVNWQS